MHVSINYLHNYNEVILSIAATDSLMSEVPLQRPEVLFPANRDSIMDSSRRLSGVPATFVSIFSISERLN